MTGIALDVSNYDRPTFDASCFQGAGVTDLFVGCQNPAAALAMIQEALSIGIPVRSTYAFLYFGLDSVGQTRAAILVAQEMGIGHVTLDVESVPPYERAGITPAERIAELRQCVRMVEQAGLRPIIYTGAWYWPSYMANTDEFSYLPLWHAAYSGFEARTVGYGGWTDVSIHQFTSQLNVCGRDRDANHIFIAPWEQEAGMAPDEKEMLNGLVDLLIGRPDGIEYASDADRLIALRAAVTNDLRFNLGLAQTQQRVSELAVEISALASGVGDQATAVRITALGDKLAALGEGFTSLGGVLSPREASRAAAAAAIERTP